VKTMTKTASEVIFEGMPAHYPAGTIVDNYVEMFRRVAKILDQQQACPFGCNRAYDPAMPHERLCPMALLEKKFEPPAQKREHCDMCGRAAVLQDVGPTSRWCDDCLRRYPSKRIAERQPEPEEAGERKVGYGPGSRWADEELAPPPNCGMRQQDTRQAVDAEVVVSAREMGADIERLEQERDEALAQVDALTKQIAAHEEICSGNDDDPPNEVDRLNPYKHSWKKQDVPTEPLAEFLHGIRYYAGMLEDDDNWSHGLGHIEELCVDFDKAIHDRMGKPYLPRDERLRADLQSWFDAAQAEKKRANELEADHEHLLFGCAEAFVRFDAGERAGVPLAVHQREWLAAERVRMARAAKNERPWDEGGRDDYYSKLPGDDRLVAGLPPLPEHKCEHTEPELNKSWPDPQPTKTAEPVQSATDSLAIATLTPHQRKCPGCRPGAPDGTPHSKECYLS